MTTIFLLTWNCANKSPSNSDVELIRKKIFLSPSNLPDIIVIGQQEAKKDGLLGLIGGHSLTERLLSSFNKMNPNASSIYGKISSKLMLGLTKPGKELPNFQHLGVICKNPEAARLIKEKDDGKLLRGSLSMSASGKGGLYCCIKYLDKHYVFITAHLDSYSDEKRKHQIDQLLNEVKNLPKDVTFFMGDLNYRLDRTILSQKFGLGSTDPSQPLVGARLARAILNPTNRRELYEADTLKTKCPLVIFSKNEEYDFKYNFKFPDPYPDLFLPTYRPNLKDTESRKVISNIDPKEKENSSRYLKSAISCFFKSSESDPVILASKKRANVVDTGWLDRIGYREDSEKNIILDTYDAVEFQDIRGIYMSDHVPVYLRITVRDFGIF